MKEMIGMLLAGGQGSRLGILTERTAKPAVLFAGKYRIIDFTLSNCINSGIDTVGVLTQYQPLKLNQHIGIGIPWELDRKNGGVMLLPPHIKAKEGSWYSGTADAIYQNMHYIEEYDPEFVIILSGDHIYKMDYSKMLDFHKEKNADVTIAVLEVPIKEASRFGIMNIDVNEKIIEFEEKPPEPKSNLVSMGVYIFSFKLLKEYLEKGHDLHDDSDFGKHIIPMLLEDEKELYAYKFKGYWQDVGTVESYWKTNMEMISIIPEFNLYEEFWKIYTNFDRQLPQYLGQDTHTDTCIISEGCEVDGIIKNSILSPNVIIEKGAKVTDSIIMSNCIIKENAVIDRCIVCEDCIIGSKSKIGFGENIVNKKHPKIYNTGITVIGERSIIPEMIVIGKNCVVHGETKKEDYKDAELPSGETLLMKEVKQ
ncbi:MAG TPA: glucose-1-phosphate adenylyltransferase [Clostridiales bacterium]|nr:MAG: glucose-1-phosphate adenylyltransferase [Clostridiales bacterium GWD2_32_19]HCC08087.1 glucose-1-phosphate adenylyltransferase [Clostridiales bacterium]